MGLVFVMWRGSVQLSGLVLEALLAVRREGGLVQFLGQGQDKLL